VVDCNGQQAFGYTRDVLDLAPLAARWAAFGWHVLEVDGHDLPALRSALAGLDTRQGPPHVLVARTTFGRGVSFMQGSIKWHYWPLSDDEYRRALAEVEGAR
jgi:transketolase